MWPVVQAADDKLEVVVWAAAEKVHEQGEGAVPVQRRPPRLQTRQTTWE